MIHIDINGAKQTADPGSMQELKDALATAVPSEHGVCVFRVNGREIEAEQLESFDLQSLRSIEIRSAAFAEIAARAVPDTTEWITRICAVLDSIAADYRLGRETEGAGRLVNVVDALNVLVHLLSGIRESIDLEADARAASEAAWERAHASLRQAIEDIADDLERGDAVQLADRTGYALPRCLGTFRELLEQLPA